VTAESNGRIPNELGVNEKSPDAAAQTETEVADEGGEPEPPKTPPRRGHLRVVK
jgi:hypothetical protein